ncbi:MAG: hypothetical protein H6562_18695 [Lewinellaceae bacterium]|nr:hypothetical protein [Lewinella sp.]MCB9280924.1 hypothetical protein [Lewinellaceae bacterium]
MQLIMKQPGRRMIYAVAILALVLIGFSLATLVCETCSHYFEAIGNHFSGMPRAIESLYACNP